MNQIFEAQKAAEQQEVWDMKTNPAWGRSIAEVGKRVETLFRSMITFTRPPIDPQTVAYESGRYHGAQEVLKMLEEMADQ
tara:strand:+ start:110 stop:349 length:240 start_codon:yes stop_codon:yes gene_type:complete